MNYPPGILAVMGLGKDYERQDCSLARALEVVGERWSLLIIRDAFYGVRRFSDFQAHLDVPRAVLAARLAALVEAGVLDKRGSDYLISERGQELWPVMHGLMRWGERHFSGRGPTRVFAHAACGARLDPDGTCPACGTAPGPEEVQTRPGPAFDPARRDDAVSRALREPHRLLEPLGPHPD